MGDTTHKADHREYNGEPRECSQPMVDEKTQDDRRDHLQAALRQGQVEAHALRIII